MNSTPSHEASDLNNRFWHEAIAIRGSATRIVLLRVLLFGAWSLTIWILNQTVDVNIGVEITMFEIAGGVLGAVLVLRTNTGYERWWEARKLWGSIINATRNIAITVAANVPDADPDAALASRRRELRADFARWTAALPHAMLQDLRDGRDPGPFEKLLGPGEAQAILEAEHMPDYVALRIGELLRDARDQLGLYHFAFLAAENARTELINHIGGCERIRNTPLPRAYRIKIRRFIVGFLFLLPFGLMPRLEWLTPFFVMLVAYPLLELDEIGVQLQNPFDPRNLGALPLAGFCDMLERNVFELLCRDDAGSRLALPRHHDPLASLPT